MTLSDYHLQRVSLSSLLLSYTWSSWVASFCFPWKDTFYLFYQVELCFIIDGPALW